jgi:hypothetical protein
MQNVEFGMRNDEELGTVPHSAFGIPHSTDFAHEMYRRKEPQPLKEYWPSLPTDEPAENDTQDAIRAWDHRRKLDSEQRGL